MNETNDSNISISPREHAIVRDILKKYIAQYDVWAFGSRVKGPHKPYSDLDLVVMSNQPLEIGVYSDLVDSFTESDLPWKVDIVDWSTTSDTFRDIILQRRCLIQKGDEPISKVNLK